MQRMTKGSAIKVGRNVKVFFKASLTYSECQQEITDLPLLSFAESATAEQFFCVCACMSM